MELTKPIQKNGEWVIERKGKLPLVIRFSHYQAYQEFINEIQKERTR